MQQKHENIMINKYSVLEQYEFGSNQIHNAYGYEIISLEEHYIFD